MSRFLSALICGLSLGLINRAADNLRRPEASEERPVPEFLEPNMLPVGLYRQMCRDQLIGELCADWEREIEHSLDAVVAEWSAEA